MKRYREGRPVRERKRVWATCERTRGSRGIVGRVTNGEG